MKKTQESQPAFSSEVYRTLIATIPHVVWVADREGNVTYLSPCSVKHISFIGSPVRDDEGEITNWVGAAHRELDVL